MPESNLSSSRAAAVEQISLTRTVHSLMPHTGTAGKAGYKLVISFKS
jgi:hypothetical protein